jgi:hypothetical protein
MADAFQLGLDTFGDVTLAPDGTRQPQARVLRDVLDEAADDPEVARNAPYATPVRRLDEAAAAKRLVIRQPL